jgi:hypothetical protein
MEHQQGPTDASRSFEGSSIGHPKHHQYWWCARNLSDLAYCGGGNAPPVGDRWPGGTTLKRHSLSMLAAVAIAGIALVATSPAAFGRPTITLNSAVGHSILRGLGAKATFAVGSCTSANPASVPCAVWSATPPLDSVRMWCLAPTPAGGVMVTVAYLPNAPRVAIPSTTLTVHCKAGRVTNVPTPGNKPTTPLITSAVPYTVHSCSTNVVGTDCYPAGESISRTCSLTATVNTLPVMVTATVTLQGVPAITGKTMKLFFRCR